MAKTQKVAGSKKAGRNKRPVNQAISLYIRGKIDFAQYTKLTKQSK